MRKMRNNEDNKKIDEYWREAKRFVKIRTEDPTDPQWFSFAWEDDARWRWELYFSWRIGFMPAGLRYLRQGTVNQFFVPCERPEEFDSQYKPRDEMKHESKTND